MTRIHDHGDNDSIPFDLTGFEALASGIRKHTRSGGATMDRSVIDFDRARQERDSGMEQAVQHAECVDDAWPDVAYSFLVRYAWSHEQFISEECTAEADRLGYGSPADPRAWGAIFQRAARNGIIRRNGYGTSHRRHLSPTPLWQSLVYVGGAA